MITSLAVLKISHSIRPAEAIRAGSKKDGEGTSLFKTNMVLRLV